MKFDSFVIQIKSAEVVNKKKMIVTNNGIKPYHKMILPEVILNNRIDKDIQEMLRPINLMLSLFLSSKYSIKDNYITPKGNIFYIATFFLLACIYGYTVHRLFFGELEDTMGINNSEIVNIMFGFFFLFFCVGFTLIFILNFVHRDINISIILLIQRIYNGVEFSGSLKKVTRWNWICIIVSVCIDIFLQFLYSGLYDDFFTLDVIISILFATLDINLVYGILLIILLRKYIEKWIEDVLAANGCEEKKYIAFFDVYQNILEAFHLYKKIFQLLVRFLFFILFNLFIEVILYIYECSHNNLKKIN